jgi:hypothetical protein
VFKLYVKQENSIVGMVNALKIKKCALQEHLAQINTASCAQMDNVSNHQKNAILLFHVQPKLHINALTTTVKLIMKIAQHSVLVQILNQSNAQIVHAKLKEPIASDQLNKENA